MADQNLFTDIVGGASLVFALCMVFLVDHVTTPARPDVKTVNDLKVQVVAGSEGGRFANSRKKLRLAVTPTQSEQNPFNRETILWDDMGKLLNGLGEGYRFDTVQPADIAVNPTLLDAYDVLFLTCAPGGVEMRDALSRFVGNGGMLYASDWRFDAVAAAFPEMVDRSNQGAGMVQDVLAEVVDPNLKDILGPTVPLRFNLPEWKFAAFQGPRVTTLLRGEVRKSVLGNPAGVRATVPLLVKLTFNKGTVIFTSFHNEKQNSEQERKLLDYLVFSLVTANIDAEVVTSIQEDGFTPGKSNLLSTPADDPKVERTYDNPRVGPLRIALGFRNEGAKLRFDLTSPDARHFSWEGESTAIFAIPDAPAGKWTYTVTALHLPYANFPFTVTFGEKK